MGFKVAARGVLIKADELKLDKILSLICEVSRFCYFLVLKIFSFVVRGFERARDVLTDAVKSKLNTIRTLIHIIRISVTI